jgi:hypothetical protein
VAVSGVALKTLSENHAEETTGYRADKRNVMDVSMAHVKELSHAKSKQSRFAPPTR